MVLLGKMGIEEAGWMRGLGRPEWEGKVEVETVLETVIVGEMGRWMLVGLAEAEAVEVVEDFLLGP